MPVFKVSKLIRFQHCDPGGVVFVSQYFNLFNEVIEDWWQQGLGIPFHKLIAIHQRGIPVRKTEAEFLAFSKLGDQVIFELIVQKIGRASLDLRINAYGSNSGSNSDHDSHILRCYVTMILVQVDLNSGKVVPWSEDWRVKMEAFKI